MNLYKQTLLATKPKLPAFGYMGGKVYLRKKIVPHFPKEGRLYFEPFAGAGSIFFLAYTTNDFQRYYLNDLNGFLQSVLLCDINKLPDCVTKEEYYNYYKKLASECDLMDNGYYEAMAIEYRVSFSNQGYTSSYGRGNRSAQKDGCNRGYSGETFSKQLFEAKQILQDSIVKLYRKDYRSFDYSKLTKDDFVYFDPPYNNTKASYPNIDHYEFVEIVNKLKCKWCISGYDKDNVYDDILNFKQKLSMNAIVQMRAMNSRLKHGTVKKSAVSKECLWMNYKTDITK